MLRQWIRGKQLLVSRNSGWTMAEHYQGGRKGLARAGWTSSQSPFLQSKGGLSFSAQKAVGTQNETVVKPAAAGEEKGGSTHPASPGLSWFCLGGLQLEG